MTLSASLSLAKSMLSPGEATRATLTVSGLEPAVEGQTLDLPARTHINVAGAEILVGGAGATASTPSEPIEDVDDVEASGLLGAVWIETGEGRDGSTTVISYDLTAPAATGGYSFRLDVVTSRDRTVAASGSLSVAAPPPPPQPPTPQPPSGTSRPPSVGVYTVTDLAPEGGWRDVGITSYYLQRGNAVPVSTIEAQAKAGLDACIAMAWKATDWHSAIAIGPSHASYKAASAALDSYIAGLISAAKAVAPFGRMVYGALEVEARGKVVKTDGGLSNETAETIGTSQSEFFARLRKATAAAGVTNLLSHPWLMGYRGGTQADFEDRQAARWLDRDPLGPDLITWDPYATGGQRTVAEIVKEDIAWIKRLKAYRGQPLALTEFGMPRKFGDDAYAALLTDLAQQFAALGIVFGILFNRKRDNDNSVDGLTKTPAAFQASMTKAKGLRTVSTKKA